MTEISSENKVLAKKILEAVGGNPKITKYWNEDESQCVDIFSSIDHPVQGVVTFSTIGLSDYPLSFRGEEYPVRIEIIGCGIRSNGLFPNLIVTASFHVISDSWFCSPGVIYPDIVSTYYANIDLKHLYFTTPFFWQDSLSVVDLGTKKVAFVLAMPISERERRYVVGNSPVDFEKILEQEKVDIFDLNRSSVI